MRRHLIAGAFACFGSSLLGQTVTSPLSQTQGALNNAQNTLQSGAQGAKNALDRAVPQSSSNTNLGNNQNRSSLNAQGQVNGVIGNDGVQSNTNLQNDTNLQRDTNLRSDTSLQSNSNLRSDNNLQSDTNLRSNSSQQFGQRNANLSTQLQGQSPNSQQGYAQQGNAFQNYGNNNGWQSSQRQGQFAQPGQFQNQYSNTDSWQNSGAMQNQPGSQFGNVMPNQRMGQFSQSQNYGGTHTLRTDANGREFICVNGRSIYFDNANSVSTRGAPNTVTQYRAGYGNYDLPNGQNPSSQSPVADPSDQQENNFQANESNNGSQSTQSQGQPMQTSQPQPLQSQNNGISYTLRTDTAGREYICVNGRPVYFDNTPSASAQPNSGSQNQYRPGYGNYDLQNGQNNALSSPNSVQSANNQQSSGSIQSTVEERTNSRIEDPANARNTLDGTRDTSPSSDRLSNPGQNDSIDNSIDRAPKANLGRDPDAVLPNDPSSSKTDLPKS